MDALVERSVARLRREVPDAVAVYLGGSRRLGAQDLAVAAVSVLHPLNPRPPVDSRESALRSLLGFDVVPAGYADDMRACLGLAGGTARDVYAAARRLAVGLLDLVPQLRDGTVAAALGGPGAN